eukprot:TRINITY_DN11748_c0_g1_i1.p2 TRINITY_DN11748_c0_g1~~TRINITY_DN11748_c0_g1_i1.p2  ORF type:complete len:100 (-),score=4.26 TRINITY_DN11748_c0_g1_i1:61-360(-)
MAEVHFLMCWYLTYRKIQVLQNSSKELDAYLQKSFKYRLQKLNEDKNKLSLFSHSSVKVNEHAGIDALMQEQDILHKTNAKAYEIVQQGYDILLSLIHI